MSWLQSVIETPHDALSWLILAQVRKLKREQSRESAPHVKKRQRAANLSHKLSDLLGELQDEGYRPPKLDAAFSYIHALDELAEDLRPDGVAVKRGRKDEIWPQTFRTALMYYAAVTDTQPHDVPHVELIEFCEGVHEWLADHHEDVLDHEWVTFDRKRNLVSEVLQDVPRRDPAEARAELYRALGFSPNN